MAKLLLWSAKCCWTAAALGMIAPGYAQERPALPFPPDARQTIEAFAGQIGDPPNGQSVVEVFASEVIDAVIAADLLARLESICGPDDSQHVERYDGTLGPATDYVSANEPSTGQLQWNDDLAQKFAPPNGSPGNVSGARWCTGTMISADEMLTAGHCFDQSGGGWQRPKRLTNGQWQVIAPSEIAQNMHVNFRYQMAKDTGEIREPTVYPITELTEYRNGGLDYAIVRLGAGPDGRKPGVAFGQRVVASVDATVGTLLTILQHPNGNPKKIEAGPLDLIQDDLLHYGDLDTQGGSSGSGVLNPAGEIVGVHVLGGCTQLAGHNKAVPIGSVRAASNRL